MSLVTRLLTITEEGKDFLVPFDAFEIEGTTVTPLELSVLVDNVALEPDETFQLQFSSRSQLPSGENVFFADLLNVIIKDQDGMHNNCRA